MNPESNGPLSLNPPSPPRADGGSFGWGRPAFADFGGQAVEVVPTMKCGFRLAHPLEITVQLMHIPLLKPPAGTEGTLGVYFYNLLQTN